MKNNKILLYLISISFILCSFLGVIHFCCFDENFYTKEHNNIMLYGKSINEHIGISNDDLSKLTSFVLDYLNGKEQTLDIKMNIKGEYREVFNNYEKEHMVDVKKLNISSIKLCIISFIIFSLSFIYFLINKGSSSDLFLYYKKTLFYIMLFVIILGIWILIDFDSFWTMFHEIFFSGNDLWLLDLRKDILIMIVPPQFFNDLVIRILLFYFISVFIFGIILFYSSKKKDVE